MLGYFPMAQHRDDAHVVWVLPDERGVLLLDRARAPKKLRRLIKTEPFEVRVDTDFAGVIAACAEARPERPDTWINDAIVEVYSELHFLGRAHSVECYRDGELVGGLYGVALGGIFCGESMFSRVAHASKVAMVYLMARLKLAGFSVLDTQFHTGHLGQFGVEEVPNAAYQRLLARHVADDARFGDPPAYLSTATVLQSITQMS